MAIGERINFFRRMRGMTQKFLGKSVGFSERSADVRIAQYETGTRTPKEDITLHIAFCLDVAPEALRVPDIDHELGLIHTLFALEDIRGFYATKVDGKVVIQLDKPNPGDIRLHKILEEWADMGDKFRAGEITLEEYNKWRYNYPEYSKSGLWQELISTHGILHAYGPK